MFDLLKPVWRWLTLIISGVGLFLSSWILISAPTFSLLTLGVAAPEVSPWLLVLNGGVFLLSLINLGRYWQQKFAFGASLLGLLISALPLANVPPTQIQMEAAMRQGLGENYLSQISVDAKSKMRSRPFILADAFLGIRHSDNRHLTGININSAAIPLNMEIYQPPKVGKYPAIIAIYGGAWERGSPAENAEFNQYMAARGYVIFAIDYRHAPKYRFPTQLDDVRTAIAFIHTHAAEYEADPGRMALLGRSSGAHLAMLAAFQPDALPIRAVIDYYGPIDLKAGYYEPPHPDPIDSRAVLTAFLGGSPVEFPSLYHSASPINYVKPGLPPTLLIYGGRDHVVQARFGKQMFNRLNQFGNKAVFLEIPWAEHAFDAVFSGVSNQLALYYTEQFLAWALGN